MLKNVIFLFKFEVLTTFLSSIKAQLETLMRCVIIIKLCH